MNKYLAPPDAKHPPGHTTGGAVDVTIVGLDGDELDMTSTISPVESPMAAFSTYSKLVTPKAAKNRRLLVDIMLGVGFSNYSGEWWLFSYGDSAWAVRTAAPFAVYSAAKPRN
jgi:D-alanyl-D-alanine dipeptidase